MSFSGSKSDSYVLRKILKRKGYNGVDNSQFHDAWVHQGAEIKVAGEKSSLNCNSGLVLPLQDFCDVEIKVGPETFKAHRYYRIPKKSPVNNSASYMFFLHVKACLTQHSVYFSKIFEKMPSTFASLDISNQDDITPAIFTLLLQWMYAGHVPMTLSTVQMMMKAAETYGIKGLSTTCYDFLSKLCLRKGPMVVHEQAEALNLDLIKRFAQNYCQTHIPELIDGPYFIKYHLLQVLGLLSNSRTTIKREKFIFDAAVKWLKADWATRQKFVKEIMDCIHFSTMPLCDLWDCCKLETTFIVQHPAVLPRFLRSTLYHLARKTGYKWQHSQEDQSFYLNVGPVTSDKFHSFEQRQNSNIEPPPFMELKVEDSLTESSLRPTKSEVTLRT